ncbi:twin-arginine translocase TatA/TatE family subunit [Pontixanthobacter aestiaquae]|nr:twin-arginine translocase TatA/TatE family subunit [Pontixanthobacter aestiaquae]MDN3646060.1 twin-arginine translocase TatA/TatE family subunit [Pontixanthobacter aestiaquae]
MSLGPWQLIIIAIVILVLFGRGRISEMMGDFGKGINSFKKGMNEDEKSESAPAKPAGQIEAPTADVKAKSEVQASKPTDNS